MSTDTHVQHKSSQRAQHADELPSFSAFKETWHALSFSDIFLAQRCQERRKTGYGERAGEYTQLLLRGTMNHLDPEPYPGLKHRLGGLFLLLTLHHQQAERRQLIAISHAQTDR